MTLEFSNALLGLRNGWRMRVLCYKILKPIEIVLKFVPFQFSVFLLLETELAAENTRGKCFGIGAVMLKMKYFNSQTKCICNALTLIYDHCWVTNSGKHEQNSEKQKFPQTRCKPVGSGSAFQSIGQYRHWNIQRKEKVKCTIFLKFAFWFLFSDETL